MRESRTDDHQNEREPALSREGEGMQGMEQELVVRYGAGGGKRREEEEGSEREEEIEDERRARILIFLFISFLRQLPDTHRLAHTAVAAAAYSGRQITFSACDIYCLAAEVAHG